MAPALTGRAPRRAFAGAPGRPPRGLPQVPPGPGRVPGHGRPAQEREGRGAPPPLLGAAGAAARGGGEGHAVHSLGTVLPAVPARLPAARRGGRRAALPDPAGRGSDGDGVGVGNAAPSEHLFYDRGPDAFRPEEGGGPDDDAHLRLPGRARFRQETNAMIKKYKIWVVLTLLV